MKSAIPSESSRKEIRECFQQFVSRSAEKNGQDVIEYLKDIHRLCVAVVRDDNRSSVEDFDAVADGIAEIATGFSKKNQDAIALSCIGQGIVALRTGQFDLAAKRFGECNSHCSAKTPSALPLAARSFQVMAEALGRKLPQAEKSLESARLLTKKAPIDDCSALNGLVAVAECLLLYKKGEHMASIECWEKHQSAFFSPVYDLKTMFPFFEAQGLITYAKTLREVGRYEEALAVLARETVLREIIKDTLGAVWGRLEKARIHRFRRKYDKADQSLVWAGIQLKETTMYNYLARVSDQNGDIYRVREEWQKAELAYAKAQSQAKASGDLWLQAHVANSMVRLFLDQDEFQKAKEELRPHGEIWKGTKNYGKYLYLLGRAEVGLSNLGDARKLFDQALDELRSHEIHSYEAFTLNHLGDLLMDTGDKEGACDAWGQCLKVAGDLQADDLFTYLKNYYINDLQATDLLPVVEGIIRDRADLRKEIDTLREAARAVKKQRTAEAYYIGHWLIKPVWPFVEKKDPDCEELPPVFRNFFAQMVSGLWGECIEARIFQKSQDLAKVDLAPLIKSLAAEVAKELGKPLTVGIIRDLGGIAIDAALIRELVIALLRGIVTAFPVKSIRVESVSDGSKDGPPRVLRFLPEGMSTEQVEIARDLVPINIALTSAKLQPYFKRGYTGDLTMADFLAGVVLGGGLRWCSDPAAVELSFPSVASVKADSE